MNPISRLLSFLRKRRYYIGFLTIEDVKLPIAKRWEKIRWLNEGEYRGGWFADPFFLSLSETRVELLVEEWRDELNRGRLSHLNIRREGGEYYLESVSPILELQTHLSFPNIWRENGKVYVYPENNQSGGLYIYEYDEFNKKLINPICIIKEPLIDTAIYKENGVYYAFAVKATHDEYQRRRLFIYSSDSLLTGWKEIQVITNKNDRERGAGQILCWHGRWIRPVQNCEGEYGEDTFFVELRTGKEGFEEEYISRIEPMHDKDKGITLHTFNVMQDLCVIDGNDFYHPFVARILKSIKRRFQRRKK